MSVKLKYDQWTRRLLMDEIKNIADRENITLPENLKSLRRDELRFELLERAEEFRFCAWNFYKDLYCVDPVAVRKLTTEKIEMIKAARPPKESK